MLEHDSGALGGEATTTRDSHSALVAAVDVDLDHTGIGFGSGAFGTQGTAQQMIYHLKAATTNDTTTTLQITNVTYLNIPEDCTWSCRIAITARSDDGESHYEFIHALIENNGFSTALVGSVSQEVEISDDAARYTVNISADDTNDALNIAVSDNDGGNTRWVARVDITQIIFPAVGNSS
ncbi:MAG: hypothetical protein ACI9HK_003258 [Pirellulaceae bacterium]